MSNLAVTQSLKFRYGVAGPATPASEPPETARDSPGCLQQIIICVAQAVYPTVPESTADATVLVVDDEVEVADVYALRLRNRYETETAYGGGEALDRLDDGGVDVVLLDRRMPDIGGDEVLEEIRERDISTRVIMITAVDPDFDIIDMPFDDYLCKPVEKDDLVAAIDQQLAARRYDDRLAEYLEVTSKLALLKGEKTAQTLQDNDDVDSLERRADELQSEMDDALSDFEDIDTAFRDITRGPS